VGALPEHVHGIPSHWSPVQMTVLCVSVVLNRVDTFMLKSRNSVLSNREAKS
jgi:hypothetical protein